MIPLQKVLRSSVGKKFLMGLSGLALVVFLLVHLAGNLALYRASGDGFNHYAATLDSYGKLLTLAELGLAGVFLLHIVMALKVTFENKAARPTRYQGWRSKDQCNTPSNKSSRNMIVTGIVLLGFLILHILQFRFGPGIEQGYAAMDGGKQVNDLYRVVSETFHRPLYAGLYVAVMGFLGMHLRHGFWSAFQSLGAMTPRFSRPIHVLGVVIAIVFAAGFLGIPIWIYFDLPSHLGS